MIVHYVSTRRRQALTLLLNMAVLPAYYYLFEYIVRNKPNHDHMVEMVGYGLAAVGVAMAVMAVAFARSDRKFEIRLTQNEFSITHPLFKEWTFSVDPQNIKSIEHHMDTGGYTSISMTLRDGACYQICKNYRYSRKGLYDALKKVNPGIALPDNPYLFKAETSDEYKQMVAARFPLISAVIKLFLPGRSGRSD
jgi:hypothetical protein